MFHKDFPFGKGVWIWKLSECLGGDIGAIIKKCHDFNISYVMVKGADGGALYPAGREPQLTKEVVAAFRNAGIAIYSWSYNYGEEPMAEAEVANQCLDLGVNGHIFDAEAEYRDATNNAQAAEVMLQAVRARHPDKFLAYAPLAIIDFHTKFPYVQFGRYCDAAMPQIYFGAMKKTPQQAILWMYDNWVRWQKNWIENGHTDSVKPISPIAQAYDDYQVSPPYILTPADIYAFVNPVAGYKSVSFWSWQHILRDDCWAAIRDAHVDAPSDADLGRVVVASEQAEPSEVVSEAPVTPAEELPAAEEPVEVAPEVPAVQPEESAVQPEESTVVEETPATPEPSIEDVPAHEAVEEPAPLPEPTPVLAPNRGKRIELPTSLSLPAKPTTVTFKPNKDDPDKLDVIVHHSKTHREYFIEFVQYLLALLFRK